MIEFYFTDAKKTPRPYISDPITCGEPLENNSPVEWLSLDDYVTKNNHSVIYVRVRGESMIDVGIDAGDLAVIDRTAFPENGSIVLARLGNTYTIKRFRDIQVHEKRRNLYLVPANSEFTMKRLKKKHDFEIVGVVTHIVKKL